MHNVSSRSAPQTRQQEYHAYHDSSGSAKLSTTVIHALADVMGQDVTDTGFCLYDSVDPDSLDKLFSHVDDDDPGNASHVAFTVDGYQTTVYSTGHIVITPPERQPSRRARR